MMALRDETRNRWLSLDPEKFIIVVINGALNDQIKLALTFISVYTQISHGLPRTTPLGSESTQTLSQLRYLFKSIRVAITTASEVINNSAATLPSSALTAEGFIKYVVVNMRQPIRTIVEMAGEIAHNPLLRDTLMPGANGRHASAVAADIQQYTDAISQLLDFAEQYVRKLRGEAEKKSNE